MRIDMKLARNIIVLAAFTAGAWGCSSSEAGNAVPAVISTAPNASLLAHTAGERVKIKDFADLPQYEGDYGPSSLATLNGALWVTDVIDQDYGENVVVEVATNGNSEATYYYSGLSSEGASFGDITAGPDGALWITDSYNGQIVRMTTDGTYTGFPVPGYVSPEGIVTGPDRALWFTIYSQNGAIGRITTKGKMTSYSSGLTPAGGEMGIASGPDRSLWFTEFTGDRIGRITTHGKITEFSKGISSGAEPYSIALGPDGALWFTEFAAGRIGRITTTGKITEYSHGITPTERPVGIAAGPDGAMWFTEYETYNSYQVRDSKIGRITTSGKITEYSKLAAKSVPTTIVQGPDDNMWFVESNADRTGRVRL